MRATRRAEYLEPDGRLAFVETEGEGEPLLCPHTAGQSGVQFRGVRKGLADLGHQVIIVDLPGHGRSEPRGARDPSGRPGAAAGAGQPVAEASTKDMTSQMWSNISWAARSP